MSKKVKFLRVVETVWLVVGVLSVGLFIYNLFILKAWTQDHFVLLGVSVVAFIMFTLRRRMRQRLEQQEKDLDQNT